MRRGRDLELATVRQAIAELDQIAKDEYGPGRGLETLLADQSFVGILRV